MEINSTGFILYSSLLSLSVCISTNQRFIVQPVKAQENDISRFNIRLTTLYYESFTV